MKCQLDDPEKLAEEVSHIHQALLSGRGDVSFPLEVAMMLLVDALKQRPALVARALGVKWDARPEQNPISRSV
jgi:hypothetical protein